MKILLLAALLMNLSCSQINQQSQDIYHAQSKIRHGAVPTHARSEATLEKNKILSEKIDQNSVVRGKALYVQHCLSCHGETGMGNGPESKHQAHHPANLQKLAKEVDNFKFFMSISQWQGDMPGWKDPFSEADREDLVAYIKTFKNP